MKAVVLAGVTRRDSGRSPRPDRRCSSRSARTPSSTRSSRISRLMTASTRCSSRRTSASPTRSPTISPIARSKKPTLSVEETVEEDEKFGVVGALAQLVERENVDDDLIVVAGDNMISFDLSDFADFFESKGTPTLAAYDVGTASAPSPTGRRSRRRRGHRLPGEARRPEDDARLHRVLRVPRGDAARPLDVP